LRWVRMATNVDQEQPSKAGDGLWLSYEQELASRLGLILSPFSTFTFTCRHHHDSPTRRVLISLSVKKPLSSIHCSTSYVPGRSSFALLSSCFGHGGITLAGLGCGTTSSVTRAQVPSRLSTYRTNLIGYKWPRQRSAPFPA